MLGFADPCALSTNPGWPLRNFLIMAQYHFKLENVNVICVRDGQDQSGSIMLNINMPAKIGI